MTNAMLMNVDDLATDYVNETAPEVIDKNDQNHLFSYSDELLREHFWGDDSIPDDYNRQDALLRFWTLDELIFEYKEDDEHEEFAMVWPCKVDDLERIVAGVDLMKLHAPGIALTCLLDTDPTDALGFTFVRSYADGVRKDPRHRDESRDLRLAIAYVCMGQLPPSIVALEALSNPLPWPVDDAIVDALKKSAALLEDRCATAIRNIGASASPKM